MTERPRPDPEAMDRNICMESPRTAQPQTPHKKKQNRKRKRLDQQHHQAAPNSLEDLCAAVDMVEQHQDQDREEEEHKVTDHHHQQGEEEQEEPDWEAAEGVVLVRLDTPVDDRESQFNDTTRSYRVRTTPLTQSDYYLSHRLVRLLDRTNPSIFVPFTTCETGITQWSDCFMLRLQHNHNTNQTQQQAVPEDAQFLWNRVVGFARAINRAAPALMRLEWFQGQINALVSILDSVQRNEKQQGMVARNEMKPLLGWVLWASSPFRLRPIDTPQRCNDPSDASDEYTGVVDLTKDTELPLYSGSGSRGGVSREVYLESIWHTLLSGAVTPSSSGSSSSLQLSGKDVGATTGIWPNVVSAAQLSVDLIPIWKDVLAFSAHPQEQVWSVPNYKRLPSLSDYKKASLYQFGLPNKVSRTHESEENSKPYEITVTEFIVRLLHFQLALETRLTHMHQGFQSQHQSLATVMRCGFRPQVMVHAQRVYRTILANKPRQKKQGRSIQGRFKRRKVN